MEVSQYKWGCLGLYQLESEVWYAHQQPLLMQKYLRIPWGKNITDALKNKPILKFKNRSFIKLFNAFSAHAFD